MTSRATPPAVVHEYPLPVDTSRVCDLPMHERPRELAERVGMENVSDQVLIALILRSGIHGRSVLRIAQDLILHYGSLPALSLASVDELAQFKGLGQVRAQVLKAALEIGTRIRDEENAPKKRMTAPADVAEAIRPLLRGREGETFWLLILDAKNGLKQRPREITRGILDASLVHPREVFREAIRTSASSVIVAHNHPSGDPAPSREDLRITRNLIECGKIIDIKLLDHIILGCDPERDSYSFVSLREDGLVTF
ncbi:MAG: DNA repair protein RadC [Kiritimatiellae bacterium]|nr:DNA repair protein RadC [Kiritimatiellia bacterium]